MKISQEADSAMNGLPETDLVCAKMNNGARIPVLGYSPIFTSTKGSSLESALEAGYRQFILGTNATNDHLIGSIIKQWYRSGKVARDDLFIAVKIDVSKVQRVTTNISQRLHDLNCGYLDSVILCNAGQEDEESLKNKWKTLEKAVQTGYSRSLGLSVAPPSVQIIESVVNNSSIKPSILLVEGRRKLVFTQIPHLLSYAKYRGIQLAIMVSLDDISSQLPSGLKSFSNQVFKYNKSPSQILVRYFLQRGLNVICESGESQTTQNSFKVLDFLIEKEDMVDMTKTLLKGL